MYKHILDTWKDVRRRRERRKEGSINLYIYIQEDVRCRREERGVCVCQHCGGMYVCYVWCYHLLLLLLLLLLPAI